MHVFGLLCITYVYAKPECMPMKHAKCVGKTCILVSAVPRCTWAVCANHGAHGSRLTFCVYMHALSMHFYVIDLLCTRRLFCKYFQKRVESCSYLTHV